MNAVAYHVVTGQAFFSGCALAVAGACLAARPSRKRLRTVARVLVLAAAGLVALSATPFPTAVYLTWAITALSQLTAGPYFALSRPAFNWTLAGLALVWPLTLVGLELPYHLLPQVPAGLHDEVYVIGDSVSAGLGLRGEIPWPAQFREQHPQVRLIDLSRAGATVSGAAGWPADQVGDGPAVVCLEIGGNDLLSRQDPADFEEGLDRLLKKVSGPDRLVVMLELPLPPFANAYGRVQRRLARRHGAVLVPKRYFAAVLAPPENTVDGIHLTNAGHRAMAALWADLLAPVLAHAGPPASGRSI